MGAETAGEQGPLNAASYVLTGVGRAGTGYQRSQQPLKQTAAYGYSTGYAVYE
jgi:hypothetical protein